jgi:uncharacterized protein (TIGR02099 family)
MKWRSFRISALWCWHQLLTLALFLLVLVAVVVGVGRQLLPALGGYRANLEASLSRDMGVPVRLAALESEWDGLGPHFRLLDLQLRDPAQPTQTLLRIPEVELRPSLWQSLRHWEVRVDVRVSGLDIHLEQQPDGRVQLQELARLASHDPRAATQALNFALRQPALALTQSRIHLALQDFPAITLSHINFVSRNHGEQHQLAGELQVPGSHEMVALQLALEGDPLDWQKSQLKLWLHLPSLRLDQWLPKTTTGGVQLVGLTGGGEYWLDFQKGQLQSFQAHVSWRDLVLERERRRYHLQGLRGLLSWSQSAAGWQLAGSQLQGSIDDIPWPVPVLALEHEAGRTTVALAHADVAGTAHLLTSLAMPEALTTWLREANPSGEVMALRADLAPASEGGQWQPQRVDVQVRNLSARATATHPGVRRLTAWVRWTPETAWLGLNSSMAELELPQIFRESVAVQKMQGYLRLQTDAERWRLSSDNVQVRNADAQGTAVLTLDIPRADPGAARLSLLARLQQARAASTWRYVPWAEAGDGTLDWLHHSILGGTVRQGDFIYEGPVHKRDDLGPHRLLMQFALENVDLDYSPGWPELHQVNATVTLDDHSLLIQGNHATLLEASTSHALSATIPDLSQPLLAVSADLATNGADLMHLFRDSPLKQHLAGLTKAMDVQGDVAGHLELQLPLHHDQSANPVIAVTAHLDNNRLYLHGARLPVSSIKGDIAYSSARGLTAPALQAVMLEAPVTASINSQVNRHNNNLVGVDVSLRGRATVPALRRWWSSPLLYMASGSLPYTAGLHIGSGDTPPSLQLNSSLEGLRLDIPAPLGKAGADTVPLRYQSTLGAGEHLARLQYGRQLVAGLVWKDGFLDRALLRLAGTDAAWPAQHGIEVEGRMARLDMRDWSPWIQRLQASLAEGTVALKDEPAMPTLTRLDVDAHEVIAADMRLQNAHVALRREGAAWRFGVASDELQGSALVPDNAAADLRLSFSRLQWPLPALTTGALVSPTPLAGPVSGLGNRPLLIDGQGLHLNAWPGVGALAIKAHLLPSPYGVRVEGIALDSKTLNFKGRMDWQWRGGAYTRLRGNASSDDVAGVLKALGYAPTLVSPQASADIDLGWPGAPGAMTPSALDGNLAITVESGRLLNVSNTTTASRVFGWFDVDNLKRRFKGDFSDVLKRGLAFDKASLSGQVQAGVMPSATVIVAGPTLNAQGLGRLDLGKKQMDQVFTVTVPVSSAVPIAAIVIAGPLIGGAIAAAQMAFEKQIDKVTQLRYHVSGDWENPAVERVAVKVLDISGKTPSVPATPPGNSPAGNSVPVSVGDKGARP